MCEPPKPKNQTSPMLPRVSDYLIAARPGNEPTTALLRHQATHITRCMKNNSITRNKDYCTVLYSVCGCSCWTAVSALSVLLLHCFSIDFSIVASVLYYSVLCHTLEIEKEIEIDSTST